MQIWQFFITVLGAIKIYERTIHLHPQTTYYNCNVTLCSFVRHRATLCYFFKVMYKYLWFRVYMAFISEILRLLYTNFILV